MTKGHGGNPLRCLREASEHFQGTKAMTKGHHEASEHFQGTKAMTRGNGGNPLHCLREASGLIMCQPIFCLPDVDELPRKIMKRLKVWFCFLLSVLQLKIDF